MIEKIAVMSYLYAVFLSGIVSFFTLFYLLFTKYFWITLAYLAWLKFDGNVEEEVKPFF